MIEDASQYTKLTELSARWRRRLLNKGREDERVLNQKTVPEFEEEPK